MKVLITGVNGYIGTHLLAALLKNCHQVVCLLRDKHRLKMDSDMAGRVQIITGDLLKENAISPLPPDIDVAFYLVQSVAGTPEFSRMEALSAHHFVQALNYTNCKQIVFFSNSSNSHTSHQHITGILQQASAALTILQTGVIIGAGSPLLQLMQDITKKLHVLVMPDWVNQPCKPIALGDVLAYLEGTLLNPKCYSQTFNIDGPGFLSFKDMIITYAAMRKIKCKVIVLPFLPSKISSWGLSVLTPVNYEVLQTLADNLQNKATCKDICINDILPRQCLSYRDALTQALAENE